MNQLLENDNNQKSSRHDKKKRTPTQSESSEKEKEEDVVHVEIASKHSECSESGEDDSTCLSELEKHLEAIMNREKLQETGRDQPYPAVWETINYPRKFKPLMLHNFDSKSSPSQHIYYFFDLRQGTSPLLTHSWPDFSLLSSEV